LGDLLEYDPAAAVDTRSELERRFFELIREADLPLPQINVVVEGLVVDAYWPWAQLVVELQGYAWHSDPETFERDHDRISGLKLAGYEVLAFTWRQVTRKPAWVVATVSALLLKPASKPIHAAPAGGAG
jgi:very-short-patch-repair endonuclease